MIDPIRLAVPSKGELADGIIGILKNAGYRVKRASARQYEAAISGHKRFHVVFMRPADIVAQVHEGRCHLGVTGFDVYAERAVQADQTMVVLPDLGYGGCRLSIAVPESWSDVQHIIDLVELANDFKTQGKPLRVSTKYPHLVNEHFHHWGIYSYQLIESDGALELHPSLGIADIIVDLTSSGATLKDNRLKEIAEGTLLNSTAIMIGHARSLRALIEEGDRGPLGVLLDAIDGSQGSDGRLHLEVVGGPSTFGAKNAASAVAAYLQDMGARHIYRGEVWDVQNRSGWRVTALIDSDHLTACQRQLFDLGASRVVGIPANFVFDKDKATTFDQLRVKLLGAERKALAAATANVAPANSGSGFDA